jgi:hypothetical protein
MITREEAFLVFNKLHVEKSTALCAGTLCGWTVLLRGRILRLSKDEPTFASVDEQASLVLRLDLDDEVFEYGEPGRFIVSVPKSSSDTACLVIGLPLRLSSKQLTGLAEAPIREKISILELREGPTSQGANAGYHDSQ